MFSVDVEVRHWLEIDYRLYTDNKVLNRGYIHINCPFITQAVIQLHLKIASNPKISA